MACFIHVIKKEVITICLQVCRVSPFLARCNPRYVIEKSSTDAKSIEWITLASNLMLLWNLICGSFAANCAGSKG